MSEKIAMSWYKLLSEVNSGLALVLWLMAGRPLPDGLGMNFRALWGALLLVHKEPWGNQISDQIMKLLLRQAEGFDEYKQVSYMAATGSKIFDRAIDEMMASAEDFSKLTDVYNTILEKSGEKDERIPIIAQRMSELPNLNFRVKVEILKRTANEETAIRLREEIKTELPALGFEQLHDLVSSVPTDDPLAQMAIEACKELAETWEELRLLVHSAIHLGRMDIKTAALTRMSRRSDVCLDDNLKLLGYSDWPEAEDCINFIIEQADKRAKRFSDWQLLGHHNYPARLAKHVADRLLDLATTLVELSRCLEVRNQYKGYKEKVLKKMLQLI